ncbi:hypothetical protein P8R33_11965 [Qipengyuania sp. XHP0211]|uniref:hypothetical protein n=1 Tax=Qipengyuania sp. XHP0211 TaxID=3038079 RepID=UPI00241E1F69|nr:hypothetical protein [Qipengyuania sp. XHP0211]MDG5751826.1 hypothetical protein [Qipengyuania sp. XHP0211]
MRKTILSLSAAALALTGGVAFAQKGERADANGDGVITLAEMQARSAERFARMDSNSDGVLNHADRQAKMAEHFARIDADNDGEVTQAEMQAAHETRRAKRAERMAERGVERTERMNRRGGNRAERMAERFAAADTDNSGGLTMAEMQAMHEARGERGHRGKRGMNRMTRLDTNGDQAISKAEFDAQVAARFARLDADDNGQVTAEERETAKAERRAKWQERRAARQAQ